MKFSEGERVVVKDGVYFNNVPTQANYLGGWLGTVLVLWPKAGMLEANQVQVFLDGYGALVFDEHQLDHDVLGKLARL